FGASLLGYPSAEAIWQEISPEALRNAGIAPEHGLAWVRIQGRPLEERTFWVVAVGDPEKLEAKLRELGQKGGATETRCPSPRLTVFGRPAGGPASVALYRVGGWALIATGPNATELSSWVKPGEPRLQTEKSWSEGVRRLGTHPDVLLFSQGTHL